MTSVARNAPCPCGSGRKRKLCCGTTREQERAARRADARPAEALEELLALPTLFPLLRPDSAAFEAWLAGVPRDAELTRALVEEALAALGDRECERIAWPHRRDVPAVCSRTRRGCWSAPARSSSVTSGCGHGSRRSC